MANTIQSLKWSDVAVPAGFVSQHTRFLDALEENQRWGTAASLVMHTQDQESDGAKKEDKSKAPLESITQRRAQDQDSNEKGVTGGA